MSKSKIKITIKSRERCASQFFTIHMVGTPRCGVQVGAARRPYQEVRCAQEKADT
jgi:hypothetical protein